MRHTENEAVGAMRISVCNFEPIWGLVRGNIDRMTELTEQAAAAGAHLILFPEMALTGYVAEERRENVTPMPLELAQTIPGKASMHFSRLAVKKKIWIVYGCTQQIYADNRHAFNIAVACSPEGEVYRHAKTCSQEGSWCRQGITMPLILHTAFGKVGLCLGRELYDMPELSRYYAAKGCFLILNPTAYWNSRESEPAVDRALPWYISSRLGYTATVNGLYIATSNFLGTGDAEARMHFPGGACVVGPSDGDPENGVDHLVYDGPRYDFYDAAGRAEGASGHEEPLLKYYAGEPHYTAPDQDAKKARGNVPGILTAVICPEKATGYSTTYRTDRTVTYRNGCLFAPQYYAKWYAEIAHGGLVPPKRISRKTVKCGVVNFDPVWSFGKEEMQRNLAAMLDYIEQAHRQQVKILVFPELALSDYSASSDQGTEAYRMPVRQAISTRSATFARPIAQLAQAYQMYIIYGAPERNEQDRKHPYNSAFVATPEGITRSYRKIHPVEGAWCTPGSEPLIVDTPWGGMGIGICMDVFMYPELSRYYAAKGCRLLVSPVGAGGYVKANKAYRYNITLDTIANREGLAVLCADLAGKSGSEEQNTFVGKSVIIGPRNPRAAALPGRHTEAYHYNKESTRAGEMTVKTVCLSRTGFSGVGFLPRYFANLYSTLMEPQEPTTGAEARRSSC